MKIAALDLGSNTFLLLICEVIDGQIIKTYSDTVEVVRLGEGLNKTGVISSAALARAEKTLRGFKAEIDKQKPDRILAMATSAARDAKNKSELFNLCDKLKIPVEIIPGEKESQITYSGATSGIHFGANNLQNQNDLKKRLVVDIGGGSTEYSFGVGPKLIDGTSLNIGCVRLTEMFITSQPTSDADILKCEKYIRDSLQTLPQDILVEEILAVAGTPTALVAAELGQFKPELIDGYELTLEKLLHWKTRLAKSTIEEKIAMGIPEGRADVILIGVLILIQTLDIFNRNKIVVSTRGVRYGIAIEAFNR